jgi:hypothetical protein
MIMALQHQNPVQDSKLANWFLFVLTVALVFSVPSAIFWNNHHLALLAGMMCLAVVATGAIVIFKLSHVTSKWYVLTIVICSLGCLYCGLGFLGA